MKLIAAQNQQFYVYILRTSRNTLYIGQTNNLQKRLLEHRSKNSRAAKYMRMASSFILVYLETHPTRSKALKREYELKQLTKKQKEKLIQENSAE